MTELGSSAYFILPCAALFIGCMAATAVYDLASYTIPNFLSLLMLAGFAVLGAGQGLSWAMLASHFSAGLVLLAAGFLIYLLGFIGGGDVKIMAATGVWAGWPDMYVYVMTFAICGGLLGLGVLLLGRQPLSPRLARIGWIVSLHAHKNGMPYGVALAIGAIWVMPKLDIFSSPLVMGG